jgi:hypothetical protein
MYRYRLVDEEGVDRGAFASPRLAFQVGEELVGGLGEGYEIVQVVAAEDTERFRAYLVVRWRLS